MYGFLMTVLYEQWPYDSRELFQGFFFILTGNFAFASDYYHTIQTFEIQLYHMLCYMFAGGVILLLAIFFIFSWRLNHRLLKNSRRTGINYYKYMAHFVDLIFFPLLFNMNLFGACNYFSTKKAVIPAEC